MAHASEPPLNRREILKLGAASAAMSAMGQGISASTTSSQQRRTAASRSPLETEICDLFAIRYPLLQAPMAGVVTPQLVAEVGRAGGLGLFAGTGLPPEELRKQIRRIKESTDRPYGVNLILHPAVRTPIQPSDIPEATLRGVQNTLNRFREQLGIPTAADRAPGIPAIIDEAFDVILDERVPVFSVGLGKPTPEMVSRCRAQGTKVICMAATVADAVEVAALQVDAIIAQGGEAGGHRSTWVKRESPDRAAIGTLSLVPQVVDAVRVPVIAAGGITNGRQLVASLALGARGVLMGTRFIATRESGAHSFYKQALVDQDSDATVITDAFTGLYARVLRNKYVEDYRASGAPVIPVVQQALASDIIAASAQRGSGDYYAMYAGQGCGMIADIPSASAVVQALISEAEEVLAGLGARFDGRL